MLPASALPVRSCCQSECLQCETDPGSRWWNQGVDDAHEEDGQKIIYEDRDWMRCELRIKMEMVMRWETMRGVMRDGEEEKIREGNGSL